MISSLKIAEKSSGSRDSLVLLRWALVVIFLWFGGMKFTSYEANGIAPFIAHSPIMSWLHTTFGVQGFPAISAPIGQFLLKDLVLLAASVCLLRASVQTDQNEARQWIAPYNERRENVEIP